MKTVMHNLLFLLSVIALILTVLIFIMMLLGLRPFLLKSRSMEPLYPKGSLVIARTRVHPDDISIGDVLIYRSDQNDLVMHRLIAPDVLKGDANQTQENIRLTDTNLVGIVCWSFYFPGLSPLIEKLLSAPWITWSLISLFIIMSCVPWKSVPSSFDSTRQVRSRH